MFDELIDRFEANYGASSMTRVKGLLYETPKQRRSRDPLQRTADYLLPGLTDHVIDINAYPPVARARDRFKEKHRAIRNELAAYLERIGRPEAHTEYNQLAPDQWRSVYLNRVGRYDDKVTPFFAETMDYLRECSSILYPIAGITFSVLEPGAYIAPHTDRTNVFVHFHQAIVTPPECGLKVGNTELRFEETESYLFDPSFVHEAWNRSQQNRVHLILPVWHPETTVPEREILAEVFAMLRADVEGAKDAGAKA